MSAISEASRPVARWQLRSPGSRARAIPAFPPIVAAVLASRGITARDRAELFYRPHLMPEYDPLLLPGMSDAVARTRRAIRDRERIALYGDFDVDGVTSVATLTLALRPLGAITEPYIPDRFSEGYGLNSTAITTLRERGCTLLITADCGISSVLEVAHANALGMDVIILDHHTVPETLPAALAAVNPKRPDSPYPFQELAAVGVALRFLLVLYEAIGRPLDEAGIIDLVALGTVVDVAPLSDENRQIVTAGLATMRRGLRPGLEALARVSGVSPERFDAGTLGFAIGPRMNAAGRLRHANLALDLMLEERPARARELAEGLDQLNRERQQQTEVAVARAEELLASSTDALLMVAAEDIHAGIVGLVAARLAERYHRPAIVFERGPQTSRGSARSIPGFDIVSAIRREKSLVLKHGGHRAAAGLTVRNEDLDLLRERLVNTAAELLDANDLQPVLDIDAEVRLADIAGKEIKGLMAFEPCGHGNERPVLLSRNVRIAQSRKVGAAEDHLKITIREGAVTWPGIAFRRGDFTCDGDVDIVFSLAREWRSERLELEVRDIAPSSASRPLEGGA